MEKSDDEDDKTDNQSDTTSTTDEEVGVTNPASDEETEEVEVEAKVLGSDDEDDSSEEEEEDKTLSKKKAKKRKKETDKRRPRVDMKAMSEYGVLTEVRMVEPTYLHLPRPVGKKNTKCQLHNFLANKAVASQVAVCGTCNVVLCSRCYRPFHTVFNINDFINNIEGLYEESRRLSEN